MDVKMKDLRDALFDEIYKVVKEDENVVFLSADAGAHSLEKIQEEFPDRYINIGVAEQNMINVACGLALSGKKVYVFALLGFLTMRCYEQIKFNMCGMKLPITLIGLGTGFGFNFDGPSHHGVHDIAVMNTLPELEILNISTPNIAKKAAEYSHQSKNPLLIRLDKGKYPEIGKGVKDDLDKDHTKIASGKDICIISTGTILYEAANLVRKLKSEGLLIGLIDLYRLKKINITKLMEEIKDYKAIITIEENVKNGGVYELLKEAIGNVNHETNLEGMFIKDEQTFRYGTRDWLIESYKMTSKDLESRIIRLNKLHNQ